MPWGLCRGSPRSGSKRQKKRGPTKELERTPTATAFTEVITATSKIHHSPVKDSVKDMGVDNLSFIQY